MKLLLLLIAYNSGANNTYAYFSVLTFNEGCFKIKQIHLEKTCFFSTMLTSRCMLLSSMAMQAYAIQLAILSMTIWS